VYLQTLLKEPTKKTPQLDFNHLTGELILSGRSVPENPAATYDDVLNWVTQYVNNPRHTTNLRLNLEYFNTASSIWLAKVIKILCQIKGPENILIIHLYFNIEDFDNMDIQDIKEVLSPVINTIGATSVSLGIKIYGVADGGEILKESLVLL
jgi:hypothetical protein